MSSPSGGKMRRAFRSNPIAKLFFSFFFRNFLRISRGIISLCIITSISWIIRNLFWNIDYRLFPLVNLIGGFNLQKIFLTIDAASLWWSNENRFESRRGGIRGRGGREKCVKARIWTEEGGKVSSSRRVKTGEEQGRWIVTFSRLLQPPVSRD